MPATTKRQRDITRALVIAKAQQAGEEDGAYNPELQAELIKILEDLDARTGRRDPRVRGKKAKRATKRVARAKKAGARRR